MDKQDNEGIWHYRDLLPKISQKYCLTLGEGNTSVKRIESTLFKCEYENPTGSVKDRGFVYQISKLHEKGVKRAVISSSGNAAISAFYYSKLAKIKLTVFVSPKISRGKLKLLKKLNCKLVITLRSISEAFQYAKKNHAYNLRQSKDPNAVFGYMTLAFELHEQNQDIDAVFIPVSSGTALAGLSRGFLKLGHLPAIHAVQTEKVYPIASLFDREFTPKKKSLAEAIVAKYTPREDEIVEIIRKSKGSAWVISDKEMTVAKKWLTSQSLTCSYEGAAALAALWKAKKKGYNYKNPVCILTGRDYQ